MSVDYSRLNAIPLFASLKEEDLAYISSILKLVPYPAGQKVVCQGDEGETFYIVDTGQVRVIRKDESGAEAVVRFLGPGQFFGETALLYDEPRTATVETVVNTTLFYIEKDDFAAMVARLPSVRKQLEAAAGRRSKAMGLGRFDWQLSDEVAVWVAHRNVIPLIFESLSGLAVGIGIAVVLAALSLVQIPLLAKLPSTGRLLLGLGAVVVFSFTLIWYIFDWTNDFLVLTNRRVLHVERYGFLREVRNEVPIQAVQNVVTSHKGFLDAILGLSDITIETIGGKLKFTHVPGAEHLRERILDQHTRVQHEARREEREAIRSELLKVLRPPSQPSAPMPAPTVTQPAAASPRPKAKLSLRELLRPKLRLEKPGEIIWRKHWLLLIGRLVGPVALLLAGPASALTLSQWHTWFPRTQQLPIWAILVPLVLIPPASFWVWWAYAVWGGDIYTLTTDRIVDIERTPLGLKETRRESTLDRIQDIEVNIRGVWARVFDIGNVIIKTAGGDFTFRAVADPRGVQRDIFHRLAEFRRREQEQRRRQTMDEMTKWLSVYNELTIVPTQAGAEEKESG